MTITPCSFNDIGRKRSRRGYLRALLNEFVESGNACCVVTDSAHASVASATASLTVAAKRWFPDIVEVRRNNSKVYLIRKDMIE